MGIVNQEIYEQVKKLANIPEKLDLETYNCAGFALGTYNWPHIAQEVLWEEEIYIYEDEVDRQKAYLESIDFYLQENYHHIIRRIQSEEELQEDEDLVLLRGKYENRDYHFIRRSGDTFTEKDGYEQPTILQATLEELLEGDWNVEGSIQDRAIKIFHKFHIQKIIKIKGWFFMSYVDSSSFEGKIQYLNLDTNEWSDVIEDQNDFAFENFHNKEAREAFRELAAEMGGQIATVVNIGEELTAEDLKETTLEPGDFYSYISSGEHWADRDFFIIYRITDSTLEDPFKDETKVCIW